MEIITLNNVNNIESLIGNDEKPNSIEEVLDIRKVKESLKDNGITNFKEITNINNISFGHFILIEKILALDKLSSEEIVKMVSPIILRPLEEPKIDNEDKDKENKHKENVFNEPVGNIYGAFNRFMDLRKEYLYKTYNGVIYGVLDESEDEDKDEDEGINLNSSQSAREFHTKRFFWNSLISDVAGGNIFKFSDAVELMMYVVMPYLAEKRSLNIVENLEIKASRI